eukprot:5411057-Lingulodinium_polyedra.AAC.1
MRSARDKRGSGAQGSPRPRNGRGPCRPGPSGRCLAAETVEHGGPARAPQMSPLPMPAWNAATTPSESNESSGETSGSSARASVSRPSLAAAAAMAAE